MFGLYHTHDKRGQGTEYVDGSNCANAGDLVCDTPADPQLSSGNVNEQCQYIGTDKDPKGDTYNPDPKNIMSYSRKACRTVFTPGQWERVDFMSLDDVNRKKTYLKIDFSLQNTSLIKNGSEVNVIATSSHGNVQNVKWRVYREGIEESSSTTTGLTNKVKFKNGGNYVVSIEVCYTFMPHCVTKEKHVFVEGGGQTEPGQSNTPENSNNGNITSCCSYLIIVLLLLINFI